MGAFHAYDIRGVYGKDFDAQTVYKVGFFLPELMHTKKILIGRDARVSSDEMREALIRGITDAGASVCDAGLCTTPMIYFGTAEFDFDCSVMITASHNPKEYNGMKVSSKNALPVGYDNGLGTIEKWILENKPIQPVAEKGGVEDFDYRERYIAFQKKYRGDYSNLKIGMDCSNGMAGMLIKDLLGDAPIYIYDEVDGTFPNHEANPLIPENVADLKKLVADNGCDLGVIYDGDADRVMFVDDRARFVSPDIMIAVLGRYFFKDGHASAGTKVLQDIRSSKSVAEYLQPMGAEIHTWKVGRAYAAHKLREIDGLFGGELAGHYYFKDFFYSDSGIMASLIIMDIVSDLKKEGIRLSELIDQITHYRNSGEINFKIEKKKEAMEAVKAYFTGQETATASFDFDGYRVEFKDWWFNIRPSNTEPYLRFIAEASTEQLLKEKVEKTREIIASLS